MRWLFSFKDPQGQMARWLKVLAQYNFKIVHREGKKHANADSQSCRYERDDSSNCYMPRVILEQLSCKGCKLPCKGCKKCQKMVESWKQFHEEVDDVIPLAIQAPFHVETQKSACLRVITKGQQKASENELETSPRSEAEPSRSEPWIGRYSPE